MKVRISCNGYNIVDVSLPTTHTHDHARPNSLAEATSACWMAHLPHSPACSEQGEMCAVAGDGVDKVRQLELAAPCRPVGLSAWW